MLRQLNTGLKEEAQIQTAISVVLGIIVFGILGLVSQCASFVQKITAPPMDAPRANASKLLLIFAIAPPTISKQNPHR